VLVEHPGVRDALVVGHPDARWGNRVAAVVERAAGADVTAEALAEHVAARLADYKKPRVIVFVPSVQRSPSGKADLRWAQSAAAGADG
jgi:acyl-CoA synthetase (AMP-forming)/AMP-acid ligase II